MQSYVQGKDPLQGNKTPSINQRVLDNGEPQLRNYEGMVSKYIKIVKATK